MSTNLPSPTDAATKSVDSIVFSYGHAPNSESRSSEKFPLVITAPWRRSCLLKSIIPTRLERTVIISVRVHLAFAVNLQTDAIKHESESEYADDSSRALHTNSSDVQEFCSSVKWD